MIKKRNAGHLLAATSGLTLALALMQPAAAADVNWVGPDAGAWTNAGNWGAGALPTAADDVKINVGPAQGSTSRGTILGAAAAETATINSLAIGSVSTGWWDGDLLIQNGSTLTVGGNVLVGSTGGSAISADADGRLSVSGGSKLAMGGDLLVGDDVGEVYVTDGSSVTVGGIAVIGRYGSGMLNIASGGTLTSNNATLGLNAGSTGTATVTGAGSKWAGGKVLTVGGAGTGTLNILNNGAVTATDSLTVGAQGGSTGTVTVDAGSLTAGSLALGTAENATGSVIVRNGGKLTTTSFPSWIGNGGNGSVSVDGSGSQWTDAAGVIVGRTGEGTLTVSNKGAVTIAKELTVANQAGSKGTVDVNGGSLTAGDLAIAGAEGAKGTVAVKNGGKLATDGAWIGGINTDSTAKSADGRLTVDGKDSQWTATGNVHVGYYATGALEISNQAKVSVGGYIAVGDAGANPGTLNVLSGGKLTTTGAGYIGNLTGTTGVATIDGNGSQWTVGDLLRVGRRANGTLHIQNGGTVTANGGVVVAAEAGSTGTLNIGNGSAGVLETTSLTRGAGAALVNLNGGILRATADNVNFLSGFKGSEIYLGGSNGTIDTQAFNVTASSDIGGVGGLTKIGSGTLTLSGASIYGGRTTVKAGTLAAGAAGVFNKAGLFQVHSGGTLDLKGYDQTLTSLDNYGVVRLGNDTPGTTLTITGNYIGNGGTVYLNTALAGDDSATDRLIVNGNTLGTGVLAVTNRGGLGGMTKEGIKLVEIGGASDGQFTLQGDYAYQGKQAVIGGAYAYQLYQGGVSTPTDGDWYLRTASTADGKPLYNPSVPVYQSLGGVAQELNGVGTLRQRVGNRYWSGAANPVIEQGDGPGKGDVTPEAPAASTETAPAVWGRIEGSHGRFEPDATVKTRYDVDTYKMQAGVDGKLYESEAGSVIGGVTVHYGNAKADIESASGNGSVDIDGYGVGGTLTWYGDNGLYVDGQAQATWYQSDLGSDTLNRSLLEDNDGFGYALSIETGKRFAIDQHWTITPQAQLTWSSVDFDSFTDGFGVGVSQDANESLKGRLGIAAEYGNAWQGADGKKVQTSVYAIANLHHEFLDASETEVGGVKFASENDATWGGIGTGGSYSWADGKYALYGEVSVDTSLENFADSYKLNGNLGLKVAW